MTRGGINYRIFIFTMLHKPNTLAPIPYCLFSQAMLILLTGHTDFERDRSQSKLKKTQSSYKRDLYTAEWESQQQKLPVSNCFTHSSPLIFCAILTKIIAIMIFVIIEQPYLIPSSSSPSLSMVVFVIYCTKHWFSVEPRSPTWSFKTHTNTHSSQERMYVH